MRRLPASVLLHVFVEPLQHRDRHVNGNDVFAASLLLFRLHVVCSFSGASTSSSSSTKDFASAIRFAAASSGSLSRGSMVTSTFEPGFIRLGRMPPTTFPPILISGSTYRINFCPIH